jgi:mevalonate kinase
VKTKAKGHGPIGDGFHPVIKSFLLSEPAMKSFEARSFGKWILAGEHAVLRGSAALVFPIGSSSIHMHFEPGPEDLELELSGPHGTEIRLLFWGVLENALKKLKIERAGVTGRFRIESNLPVGAGLGASAVLCVLVGRWCAAQGWIGKEAVYEFSRSLEDLFHGESSGVDIAVALSGEGLRFTRSGERSPLKTAWKPRWYLSYSGRRGVTSECVGKVKALFQTDLLSAQQLDEKMAAAVELAERALGLEEEEGFVLLKRAIDEAEECFRRWGLAEGDLGEHLKDLKRAGAVAVKPTGSGGGGYALSLWKKEPPSYLPLLPV